MPTAYCPAASTVNSAAASSQVSQPVSAGPDRVCSPQNSSMSVFSPCAKAERVYVPGCSSTVWLSVIDAPMLLYQLAECAPPCTAVSLQESVVALFWPRLLTLTVQGLSLAHRSVSNPLSFSRDSAASSARAAGVSASSMVSAKSRLYTRRQKVVCIFT